VIPYTAGELALNRAAVEGTMQDTCVRLAYSDARDSDNEETAGTHTPAETFVCGFTPAVGRTLSSATRDVHGTGVVITESQLRLPIAADGVFQPRDRVRLTHRFEMELAMPVDFEIAGTPFTGMTAVVLALHTVET
jgi:hypothetical protein